MKNKWGTTLLAVAAVTTALSAIWGLGWGIRKYTREKETKRLSSELAKDVVEYLRGKKHLGKGEILKYVTTEKRLIDHFKNKPLEDLRKMKRLETTALLNKHF